MKAVRRAVAILGGAVAFVVIATGAALAQIDPTGTPVENKSPMAPLGPLPSLAAIAAILGLITVVALAIRYMRFAPRFTKGEQVKVVRADRPMVGQELPRRNVDLSKAVPMVVAPPAIPVAAPVAAPAVAAVAPAVAAPPAAAPPAAAVAAPAAAPAPAVAPAAAPEAPAPAAPPATPAPAPAAVPSERVELALDQAVYETTLKELLDAGTDRRIAEGKARRAGMIAAKKAAGG